MSRVIQPNFSKGEVSPTIYGRVDSDAYKEALATARNTVVHSYGGISNRAGTVFIGPVKDHAATPRLIPFQFSTTDSYMLEFGNLYMRVIRNNAYVTEPLVTITGITNANPGVVTTSASHGYTNGDEVSITSVGGMLEVNNRRFVVANATATTFELQDQIDSVNVNTTAWGVYTSGGSVGKIYELATLYASADLFQLQYAQTANILTITHPSYKIQELTRTDHDNWTIQEPAFLPEQDDPITVLVTVNTTGAVTSRYKVTAISESGEESLSGLHTTSETITGITAADPPVVTTSAPHGYSNGDEVEINSVGGMTEVNGRRFLVNNVAASTFELTDTLGIDIDGTGFTAYTSGGVSNLTFYRVTNSAVTIDNTVSWAATAGASKYAVYRETNGIFGLLGETETTSFEDDNIAPDTVFNPPKYIEVFFFAGDVPGAVGYFQQRRVFGGSNNAPDQLDYSKVGLTDNFTFQVPRQEDDAIIHTLTSQQVNQIRHIVPLQDLLIFTSGSEWAIDSGPDSFFSITTLRQREQSTWGSSFRRPLIVGTNVLFVQTNNSLVRNLGFDGNTEQWEGSNVGLLADHMLRDNTITDWALSRFPDPVIYMVRDDGVLLTLTFDIENKVVAWTTWDTDGKFESVATLRTELDALEETGYFVVKRTINGKTVRLVEYLHTRRFSDVRDAFFLDSGLSLDAPIAISGTTAADPVVVTTAAAHGLTDGDDVDIFDIEWVPTVDLLKNSVQPDQLNKRRYFVADKTATTFSLVNNTDGKQMSGATQANPIVITSTAHGFADGDVIGIFNVAGMVELNGNTYKVANRTADTYELTDLADVAIDSTGFTAYTSGGRAYHAEDGSTFSAYVAGGTVRSVVDSLLGLWHLPGETVQALIDGNVVIDLTVSADGAVTLPTGASRVHIGLPYVSDVQTLPIEISSSREPTAQGRDKKISDVTVKFERSRGLLIGNDTSDLTEMKQREDEPLGEPTVLLSGDKIIPIAPDWNLMGQVFIRQIYPLPMTILAVVPNVEVGD
jgi:hypothetical protein